MPEHILPQVERVRRAVRRDVPVLRQVGHDGALGTDARQPVKDQRHEVAIHGILLRKDGVDGLRISGDPLDVGAAIVGDDHRRHTKGEVSDGPDQHEDGQERS